ncbi:MAG TPA: hypothetical protein VHL80_18755 [Polyangia bacterium]|nr:hypothetical protein [Polyangia bacterium]
MRLTAMFRKRWAAGLFSRARLGVLAIALGGALAGCGGGGGGGAVCAAPISVTWDFLPGTGCQPGDSVTVRVDDNTMLHNVPCTDFGAETPAVEGGVTHAVDLTLFDGAGNPIENSGAIQVPVGCGPTPADAGNYSFSS